MRVKLFVMFTLLSAALFGQDIKVVSLEDCIKIGIENSKTLKISGTKIISAKERLNEIMTAQLPTLRLNGSYSRLSPVDPFQIGSMQISPSILDNYSAKLSLSQPIFTGNRLSSTIELTEFNSLAAETDFSKDKNQLILDIKVAYWNYAKSLKVKETIEKNMVQVSARLQDLENLYDNGLATNNEVLKVRVQLSNIEILLIDAVNNIDISLYNLNNTLGIPVNTKLEPKAIIELKQPDIPKLDDLIKASKQNRSDLKSLDYRIKSGEAGITLSKSGWYPQLNFNANYLYANPNSRIFPSVEKFKGTWDLGITLSYDLWNWKLTSYQTKQAEANLEQIKISKELTENNIDLEVSQNYKSLLSVTAKMKLTKETVEQAKENYRVTNEKYKSGLLLNSEVVDAETSLLLSEINNITTIADYLIVIARLEKSIENTLK
ncbi:MAG: TolC family protein [Ignavibacteriae bacterium]|nr:TolC family protein [Ignavibacteriota bacterium]